MTPADWAGLSVAVITIVTSFVAAVKWLVKHYLAELKPNGGSSMNDRLTKLETKLEVIYNFVTKGGV